MRLVPTFDETRIEEFFVAFETLADKLQWEEYLQTVLLQTKCIGKAQMPLMLLTLTNANLTIL